MAIGRPPKYDDDYLRTFGRAIDGGMTVPELGRAFSLDDDAVRWLKRKVRPELTKRRPKEKVDPELTDKPLCACGGRIEFATNGYGATLERCVSCGITRAMPIQGKRKHDQRIRLQKWLDSENPGVEGGKTGGHWAA